MDVMKSRSNAPCVAIVVVVFVLLVVHAVFVGLAGGEMETHVSTPLTGKEEIFKRTKG
jgi:hypothetical protein